MSEVGESSAGEDPGRAAIWWRQLDPHLWAGRSDDGPVGTIEHGRGFVFVDLDGDRHVGFRTLDGAQSAATGATRLPLARPARGFRTPPRKGLVVAAVVVVAVIVVTFLALRYVHFG